jgi:hypothetical protein
MSKIFIRYQLITVNTYCASLVRFHTNTSRYFWFLSYNKYHLRWFSLFVLFVLYTLVLTRKLFAWLYHICFLKDWRIKSITIKVQCFVPDVRSLVRHPSSSFSAQLKRERKERKECERKYSLLFAYMLLFSLSFSIFFHSVVCACVYRRRRLSSTFTRSICASLLVPPFIPPSLHISFAPPLLHHRRSTPVSTASSKFTIRCCCLEVATTRWNVSRKWSMSLVTNK